MSGITLSGSYSALVTLASSRPDVTVSGTITAYGAVGTYTIDLNGTLTPVALSGALFGPAGTDFTIDNTGVILSSGSASNWFDAGLALGAPGDVTNSGTIGGNAGLFMFGTGTTPGYVTNSKLIEGTVSVGIFSGAALTVQNTGTISGVKAGIIVQNASASYISNSGAGVISASAGYAVQTEGGQVVNAGQLTGLYGGVSLDYWGTLNNTGTILGTAVTAGTNGSYAAVNMNLYGTPQSALVINAAGGKIEGQYGVRISEGGSNVTPPATLLSSINNAGTIMGTLAAGVADWAGTALVQNSGDIIATATTLGTQGNYGGVVLSYGGVVSNSSAGTISGALGVKLGNGTVDNAGAITGTSSGSLSSAYSGVYIQNNGAVYNALTGHISGASGVRIDGGGANYVSNAGSIGGGKGVGVYFLNNGTVSNSGTITGAHRGVMDDAVNGNGAASVLNSGLIQSTANTFSNSTGTHTGAGIVLLGGGDISNTSQGIITGANGMYLKAGTGGTIAVNNAGHITGTYKNGIVLASSGDVTNSGTITSTNGNGVFASFASYIDNSGAITSTATHNGVYGLNGLTLINAGSLATISGGGNGVYVHGGGATVQNAGVIEGLGTLTTRAAVQINGGGTVGNNGTLQDLSGNGVMFDSSGGTLTNAGVVQGGNAGVLFNTAGATLTNSGTIAASNGIGVAMSGGGILTDSGTITGTADAVSFGSGNAMLTLETGANLAGAVVATSGFNNDLNLAGTGSFNMGGSVTGFSQFVFEAGAQWTLGGTTAELTGNGTNIVNGFAGGDTLVLDGFTATSDTFTAITGTDNDMLALSNGTSTVNVNLTGSFSAGEFTISSVAAGTEIHLCYARGTHILTPTGEVPVEALAVGDEVVTRHGARAIKWIGRQSYAGRFLLNNPEKLPVRVEAGALGEGLPARDMRLSPGHAVLLDGTLVLAKALVNGITVTQDDAPALVDYFAVELETHDCLLAEGVWAESFADGPGLRTQFHNLADFRARFPAYVEPDAIALCAPRPEHGPALAAALAPVVARAAAFTAPGPLRGRVDLVADGVVEGWAQDEANPELPVMLEVCHDDVVLATVLACDYREDLARAGIGKGRAMFSVTLPGVDATTLTVRRAADGRGLAPAAAFRAA